MSYSLSKIEQDMLAETIAFERNISISEAKQVLRSMSFADFSALIEATVDRNPSLTAGLSPRPATAQSNQQAATSGFDSNLNNPVKKTPAGTTIDQSKDSRLYIRRGNQKIYVEIDKIQGNQVTVKDEQGRPMRVSNGDIYFGNRRATDSDIKSRIKSGTNRLKSSFAAGQQFVNKYAYVNEDEALANLAGPTIVGNTADSHKPTVQLRKKERLEKQRADRKKENKFYEPEEVVKSELGDSAARYYRTLDKK